MLGSDTMWRRVVLNRWQILMLTLGMIGGVTLLVGAPRPGSLNTLLPPLVVLVWAVMLTVGCGVGVAALVRGWLALLRVGMTLLAAASLAYWVAILGTTGPVRAVALGWPVLGFAACAIGDVWVITRAARKGAG